METWDPTWNDALTDYLVPFRQRIGDQRTWTTLTETVRGILASGTLRCTQIAAKSPILAAVKDGAQRIRRMVKGHSTTRSDLTADTLIADLRTQAIAHLAESVDDELWLIADGSDLRKPYARDLPALMKVRALEGGLVPGYRTMTVLGLTPKRRGILYHHLWSTYAADFMSEPLETQKALKSVHAALAPLRAERPTVHVSWILDAGFDDIAVWRTIWEQQEHLVVRLADQTRRLEFADGQGGWRSGSVKEALRHARLVGTAETMMEVRKVGQKRAKDQRVVAELRSIQVRLRYDQNVRRTGGVAVVSKEVWLVEVRLRDTTLEPWVLLSDWSAATAEGATRIFQAYRQRWSVEDAFKTTKETLGWEEVQVMDLAAIRMLVALAWVAAGFLYELGVTLEWPTVRLLAKLGGWEERKDRPPGKITLLRGVRRLMEMVSTNAWLNRVYREEGPFPPQFAAFLRGWRPDDEL